MIRVVPLSQTSLLSVFLSSALWAYQIRRLIKRIKPDILHAHFIGVPGYLGAASGFRPLVLTAWGSDILVIPRQNPVYRFLTKYALKRADRIISVSSVLKEEIIKLGVTSEKIDVTPIGVDTQQFSPRPRNKILMKEFNIGDSPVVISTRSLSPIYDVETLIKAIPLVLQVIPEAIFIIAGDGGHRWYLESLARSLKIVDSTRFVGWIPNGELPSYLALSDVYVSTSLSDGTSISLLEAIACKLAPVVTDIPANRVWVTDGESGFLFPTGDYETLASRISLLLNDGEIRTRFGQIGREAVMGKAEHKNEMFKVEEMYQGLRSVKQ